MSGATRLELTWLRQIGLFLASAVYKTYLAPRADFSLPSQPRAPQSIRFPNLSLGAPAHVAAAGLHFLFKGLLQNSAFVEVLEERESGTPPPLVSSSRAYLLTRA